MPTVSRSLSSVLPMLGLLCVLGCAPATWAQQSAARIMVVTGTAKAVNAQGQERKLEKGGEVFAGEKIVTADNGLVQLRLHDGGYMSVRPSTEMVIDRFVYDEKDAANSNFLVSLVRGGFRSITGLIGRTNPAAYQIRTTTATLGIRGTDHEPMVVPEGLAGPAGLTPPGMYDKVNDGETFIQNKFGVLSLKRGDVGFAPAKPEVAPQVLQKIPDFYKIDIKTDGRDSKDATDDSKSGTTTRVLPKGALLRPTLAIRKDAVVTETKVESTRTVDTTTPTTTPVLSSTVLQTTTVVKEPLTTTTLTVPTTTLVTPVTTLAPVTTTVISPVTTVTPVTTTIVPTTTVIVPRTTTTITTK